VKITLFTSCHARNSPNCESGKGAVFFNHGVCGQAFFFLPPPLPPLSIFFACPNFRAAKKQKCIEQAEKAYENACYAGLCQSGLI